MNQEQWHLTLRSAGPVGPLRHQEGHVQHPPRLKVRPALPEPQAYTLSKPRTLRSRADSARACFSPGLISGSYPSMRADNRCARLPGGGVALRSSIAHPLTARSRRAVDARHPSVTLDRASYALFGSRTPARADSARACFSPGLIPGPRPSVRADKLRASLRSPQELST